MLPAKKIGLLKNEDKPMAANRNWTEKNILTYFGVLNIMFYFIYESEHFIRKKSQTFNSNPEYQE